MKVSDYIVEYLIKKDICDIFGYPGGMVTHFMDSCAKYSDKINSHVTYHEQGAAFAACGYAQTSGKPGVAYATSGPGATNLITGICNAYFDSIPTIFITGQVNSYELKGNYEVRQRGFQETDIVSMVRPVTKYAVSIQDASKIPAELDKAYNIAISNRMGPVLLDISMDVFHSEISADYYSCSSNSFEDSSDLTSIISVLKAELSAAKAPVFIIGNGLKISGESQTIRRELNRLSIPVVSSMIAFDIMNTTPCYYGFVGAYGTRAANFIIAKSDLVIAIGTRMDIRQVGKDREGFAPNAKLVRFDVDPGELSYRVHGDEYQICTTIASVANALKQLEIGNAHKEWVAVCDKIKSALESIDDTLIGSKIALISETVPDEVAITTDVGQNQVWIAQSFKTKCNQKILFSGGHGAMGYSLPAAIGAYYGTGKKMVYCFTGDGGMQMNIQELQFIAREEIPIKIIVFNNNALGMIRHFQEMCFEGRYFQTKPAGGYSSPEFAKIAKAYGINSRQVELQNIQSIEWLDGPELLEIMIRDDTYISPKLEFGKPNQDQEPLLDRELYNYLMEL